VPPPPPSAGDLLERKDIKLVVPGQRKVNLLGHRSRTGFFHEELMRSRPVGTPLTLLRECKDVGAGVTDGSEYPAVRGRKRVWRERRGKILWRHWLQPYRSGAELQGSRLRSSEASGKSS
jgi:hypothetical protein